MNFKTSISVIALASVMGLMPAMAQDQTIDGKPVPSAQVEEVQTKCDELRAAGGDAAAGPEAGAPAGGEAAGAGAAAGAEAPAAGAPAAGAEPAAPAAGAAPAETPAAGASAEAQIDIDSLTLEMCDEGGFTSSSP